MYKVGDKVVPHSKNVGVNWLGCEEWEKAQKNGQRFLYVTKIDDDDVIWCAYLNDYDKAECFKVSDLTPYIEEKSEKKADFHDLVGTKLSKYKVKDLLDLVNNGILLEEDEVWLGRTKKKAE